MLVTCVINWLISSFCSLSLSSTFAINNYYIITTIIVCSLGPIVATDSLFVAILRGVRSTGITAIDGRLKRPGKDSPITSNVRKELAGYFFARHFSISRHCDGCVYLLSVAVLTFAASKGGQLLIYHTFIYYSVLMRARVLHSCTLHVQFRILLLL